MKRVLAVGVTYTGPKIDGVEIENLGLCQAGVDRARAAFPLYEYDTIIMNPQSYSHFLFGAAGEFSDELGELGKLKRLNDNYDIDTAFLASDRQKEMEAALADGATVVWCLSEPKRVNFSKAAVRARRRLVEQDKLLAGEKAEIGGRGLRP